MNWNERLAMVILKGEAGSLMLKTAKVVFVLFLLLAIIFTVRSGTSNPLEFAWGVLTNYYAIFGWYLLASGAFCALVLLIFFPKNWSRRSPSSANDQGGPRPGAQADRKSE